jgi:hypothetical protein
VRARIALSGFGNNNLRVYSQEIFHKRFSKNAATIGKDLLPRIPNIDEKDPRKARRAAGAHDDVFWPGDRLRRGAFDSTTSTSPLGST